MQASQTLAFETAEGRDAIFKKIVFQMAHPDFWQDKSHFETKLDIQESRVERELKQGDWVQAIRRLHLLDDEVVGIKSDYVKLDDEHTVLLRDARHLKLRSSSSQSYAIWAIMGLNYIHAMEKLLSISHDQKAILIVQAQHFYTTIKSAQDPEAVLTHLYSALVKHIATERNLSEKEAAQQLNDARDFCNFEHETIAVATAISVKNFNIAPMKILQIDVPMCGSLSAQQRKEFEILATPESDATKITWFKIQKPHIQKLIRQHARYVLAGKMIPTQLRKFLPGIRNAGEERVYDMEAQEQIYQGYHAGTPAHLLGEETINTQQTTENIQQLVRLINADNLNLNTLISPLNPFAEDEELHKQITDAVKSHGENQGSTRVVHQSNTPFNLWRVVSDVDRRGINFIYAKAQELLKAQKETDESSDVIKLRRMVEEYDEIAFKSDFFDSENRNLKLLSLSQNMTFLVNKILKRSHLAQIEPCQSGKDRQGLARISAIIKAILLHILVSYQQRTGKELPNDAKKQIEAAIRRAVALSGTVQKQAGMAGGTIGAAGIKIDTAWALPKSWSEVNDVLVKKTASYNSGVKIAKPWYKNKKFWIGLGFLILGLGLCTTGVGSLAGVGMISVGIYTASAECVIGGSIAIYGAYRLSKAIKSHNMYARQQLMKPVAPYNFPPQLLRSAHPVAEEKMHQGGKGVEHAPSSTLDAALKFSNHQCGERAKALLESGYPVPAEDDSRPTVVAAFAEPAASSSVSSAASPAPSRPGGGAPKLSS